MRILIKGAGDLASGAAYELWLAGHEVLMTEIKVPLTVRRGVSFSRAVYEGRAKVERAEGVLVRNLPEILFEIENGSIPVLVDERAEIKKEYRPDVLVDAIMAKKNTGTHIEDAPLVIAGQGHSLHGHGTVHFLDDLFGLSHTERLPFYHKSYHKWRGTSSLIFSDLLRLR